MRLTSITVVLLLLSSTPAVARTHRVNQIPYGSNFGCTSCHVSSGGGGVFTGFGSDSIRALVGAELLQNRDVDWSQLAGLDSDRDGFTNGEEVYDPDGLWSIGDPNPVGGVVFNPGDPSSHPFSSCGDGRVTPPEECDGTNHRDLTCIGLGMEAGVLTCQADCKFDRSGCGGGEVPNEDVDAGSDPEPEGTPDDEPTCAVSGQVAPSFFVLLLALTLARRGRRRTP